LSIVGADAAEAPPQPGAFTTADVRPLLAALDQPEREILERTYLLSESIAEVAGGMGLAEGTVKSHLHRAHKRLAARFEREDWL